MIQMLAMTASMMLVGWIVWKVINRHEDGDAALQSRLNDDDRRAAIGRGEPMPEDRPADD